MLVGGCQSLDTTHLRQEIPADVAESATEPESDAAHVDAALVDDFRRWLDQEAWQADVGWNVTDPRGPCPSKPWRWSFLPSDQPQPAAAPAKPATAPPKPGAEERWSWVWHGDGSSIREDEQSAALAALEACRTESGRVGVNAAILLARLQPDRHDATTDQLRVVCESVGLTPQVVRTGAGIDSTPAAKPAVTRSPINARCAAAEPWCVRLAVAGEPYEAALLPAGRLLLTPGLPDELRGTLWRCLARWLPPDRLPTLAEMCAGLDHPSGQSTVLQRAALEACVIAAWQQHSSTSAPTTFVAEHWPLEIERARRHGDPGIRKLYGRWMALSGHPELLPLLNAQRHDTDSLVREAAIFSLGLSVHSAAREQLEHVARHDGERDRVTAVEALSQWGPDALEPFVTADAPAVRAAVARGLSASADARSDRLLRRLLIDPHPDVQSAALATARSWPADWAVPALLDALRGSLLAVRQEAVIALRELTHEEPPVPIDGLPEARDIAVRQWASAHGWRVGGAMSEPVQATNASADQAVILSVLDDVLKAPAGDVHRDAWDRLLTQARPTDIAAIERALIDSRSPSAETIRRELLPRLDDAYAALRDLSDGDVQRRREAARRLLLISRSRSLSPALLRSLHAVLLIEQDQLVWQQCLEAVQADGHDAAGQLALLAIHHTWPDIRRLGVAHMALHPTPEAAGWLMPLFRDENRSVQQAAIAAAARCGNPVVLDGYPSGDGEAMTGLRPLLMTSDHELRWTVLETMATLRDDQAATELTRLTYDPHPRVREQAARAMGTTGDSRFVEALIRWSWTESADPVKQAILSSLDELTPVADRPENPTGLAAPLTIDDKIRQWAVWWERHAPRPETAPRSSAASESRPTS
ncbi:MAG TPA: HEAT repeat domain-containing protein [Planctomycetaceae bacterium]|nr:HEAT repeat domain-containing protein [Planctomycetaceae bacterium]